MLVFNMLSKIDVKCIERFDKIMMFTGEALLHILDVLLLHLMVVKLCAAFIQCHLVISVALERGDDVTYELVHHMGKMKR